MNLRLWCWVPLDGEGIYLDLTRGYGSSTVVTESTLLLSPFWLFQSHFTTVALPGTERSSPANKASGSTSTLKSHRARSSLPLYGGHESKGTGRERDELCVSGAVGATFGNGGDGSSSVERSIIGRKSFRVHSKTLGNH